MSNNETLIKEVMLKLKNIIKKYKLKYVSSSHLLLAIILTDNNIYSLLVENNFNKKIYLNKLEYMNNSEGKYIYTNTLKKIFKLSRNLAKKEHGTLNTKYLLRGILSKNCEATSILQDMNVKIDNVLEELNNNLKKNLEIYKIGYSLNKSVSNNDICVNREEELEYIIETLLRKEKNNPLLIGDEGVGKTKIVEELARRINNYDVPRELYNKEIIVLEMGSLISGTKYRGEFEERLNQIIKEVREYNNIILYIDEIHTMVNCGASEGAVKASDILKPYLARGDLKIIGSTTTREYQEFFSKDKALSRRFENIIIKEPSIHSMRTIMNKIKKNYEYHYNIKISKENIDDLILFANKYLLNKHNPDKTIELLDSVCSKIKYQKYKEKNYKRLYIKKDDIIRTIKDKSNGCLTDITNRISLLENELKNKIYGQNNVIDKIISELKLYGINGESFLLCGPSGIGKTYMVNLISKILDMKLITVNMDEYKTSESVNKIIGDIYNKDNYALKPLITYPYAIVLFEHVDLSNPVIVNLISNILDNKYITNQLEDRIDFNNTLIFMTSKNEIFNKPGFLNNANNIVKNSLMIKFDNILIYNKIDNDIAYRYLKDNIKNIDINILNSIDIKDGGFRILKKYIDRYKRRSENDLVT